MKKELGLFLTSYPMTLFIIGYILGVLHQKFYTWLSNKIDKRYK